MGKSAAPNVAWAVFWAFLAPIGLFIGLLWALERWLPDFETARLRTSVIFIIGFGVTAAVMWTIKMVKGKMMRHQ